MDSVRFGRALGIGARSAVKALAQAADAAATPNPSPGTTTRRPAVPIPMSESMPVPVYAPSPAPAIATQRRETGPIADAARIAARAAANSRRTREGVARGGRRFGEAVWGPLAKITGVLWLEITGAFFGLFALFAGSAVWAHRTDLYSAAADHDARIHAFVFLGMALGFGYFCVSSFFRARRR